MVQRKNKSLYCYCIFKVQIQTNIIICKLYCEVWNFNSNVGSWNSALFVQTDALLRKYDIDNLYFVTQLQTRSILFIHQILFLIPLDYFPLFSFNDVI